MVLTLTAPAPMPLDDQDRCRCGHARRSHSKNGCEDYDLEKGVECPCKVKYMDLVGTTTLAPPMT